MKVSGNTIIRALKAGLIINRSVNAMWLEGSEATNRVDRYSDLDICLDVQDGCEKNIGNQAITLLHDLSPVDYKYEWPKPHPQIWHYVVHLQGTPKTLVIDLNIQSHSRKDVFIKGLPEHQIKVIFDKNNTINYCKQNKREFAKDIKRRIDALDKRYNFFFDTYYYKNVLRGKFIEAFYYYLRYVVEPIIELSRIKHCPDKLGSLGFKHIEEDLPKAVVRSIEHYYKASSLKELETKSQSAKKHFNKLIKELKKEIVAQS
jgi:hypothetical protein